MQSCHSSLHQTSRLHRHKQGRTPGGGVRSVAFHGRVVSHSPASPFHPITLAVGNHLYASSSQRLWPIPSISNRGDGHLSLDIHKGIQSVSSFCYALYKFTRPHTMIGTALSIVSVSLLALQGWQMDQVAMVALFQALTSALLANVSIVGLNQVFDVEVDKINKPYLPLASGEISVNAGIGIVIATAVGALVIGVMSSSTPLLWTLIGSLVLGVLYSTELPFMRWKKYPFLAAACILAVRAVFVQLGFFYHMKLAVSTAQLGLTPPLLFTCGFMLFFSIVIALFKDIPDVYGDDKLGIRTFSVRHGVPAVFWTCVTLLIGAYSVGILYGLSLENRVHSLVTVAGHLGAALVLFFVSRQVNLKKKQALVDHYMFVWKLFYAEYLFIPFFC